MTDSEATLSDGPRSNHVDSGSVVPFERFNGSLPKLDPETDKVNGYRIVAGPFVKETTKSHNAASNSSDSEVRESESVILLVQRDDGLAVAKVGPNDPAEIMKYKDEYDNSLQAVNAWPHAEQFIVAPLEYAIVKLPDVRGEMREHPVLFTKYIAATKAVQTPTGTEYTHDVKSMRGVLSEKGGMGVRRAIKAMFPVAGGADALKAIGLVHRDIKPRNIFMHNGVGILGDAGIMVKEGYRNPNNEVEGSPGYFAPEQMRNDTLTYKTNVWGFGAVMFEVMTGQKLMASDTAKLTEENRRLFRSKDTYEAYINERIKGVPPLIRYVLWKAIAFDPKERYESCMEFMLALDKAEQEAHKPFSKLRGNIKLLQRRMEQYKPYRPRHNRERTLKDVLRPLTKKDTYVYRARGLHRRREDNRTGKQQNA